MSSRITLTLVLLGLCIALGGGLYYAERERRATGAPLQPLSSRRAETVRCIHIQHRDRAEIAIARDNGQWQIIRPLQAPALEQRVHSILSVLETPAHGPLPRTAGDLKRFGLEPPAARLLLDDMAFDFGVTESLYARRYVLHAGRIHLTDDYLFPQLTQPVRFFVDTGEELQATAGAPEVGRVAGGDNEAEAIHRQHGAGRDGGDDGDGGDGISTGDGRRQGRSTADASTSAGAPDGTGAEEAGAEIRGPGVDAGDRARPGAMDSC